MFAYIKTFFSSDIITNAAKSVSCAENGVSKTSKEFSGTLKSSLRRHPCTLYDKWLEKLDATNETDKFFTTETDWTNKIGYKIPGIQKYAQLSKLNCR